MPAEDTVDENHPDYKRIHQPWALPLEEKLAAYTALLDCDFTTLLLNAPGTRHAIANEPSYGHMLAELKHDKMALDRAVLSGKMYGVLAAGILSKDLKRRKALPKAKAEVPPANASEAKAHATKLFSAKRFAQAADAYALAIRLLDLKPRVSVRLSALGSSVKTNLTANARSEQQAIDEEMAHTLYGNLAACRVKQHRWTEAIEACSSALELKPDYVKALMRRATSKRGLRDWEGAIADALAAKEMAKSAEGADASLAEEINRQADAIIGEAHARLEEARVERARQEREENGLALGQGEPIYGEHFDHILKRELIERLTEPCVFIDELNTKRVGMCRVEDDKSTRPGELGAAVVNGPDFTVEASVRSRGAKRFLYYSIDITIPWRGILYAREKEPHWRHDVFRGVLKLWNISHWTEVKDYRVRLMERPPDGEVPGGAPPPGTSSGLIPMNKDGTPMTPVQQIEAMHTRKLPEVHDTLLTKYGPKLAAKVLPKVDEALEALRDYLGEYRSIYTAPSTKRSYPAHAAQPST